MICPDSYLMHLAGSLQIPTVALFTTVPARLRTSRYHSVLALESDEPCSPCLVVRYQTCPKGHSECVAMHSPVLAPAAVLQALEAVRRGPKAATARP